VQQAATPVIEEAAPSIVETQPVNVDTTAITPAVIVREQVPVKPDPIVEKPAIEEKTSTPAIAVQEEVVEPEPRYEVVKKGKNRDELVAAHYVIVGAFKQRENADRYSRLLKDAGYNNGFGFASEKQVYYVHVFQSADLNEARTSRDAFRKLKDFQFQASWVLTVQE
jgi:cell division septation protein DedD